MNNRAALTLLTVLVTLPVAVAVAPFALAQEESGQEPIRASEYQRSDQGPAIVIRNEGDNTYYEYRVNGELKEIKVKPSVGPAYYLIPVEGGYIRQDASGLRLPSWVLFQW